MHSHHSHSGAYCRHANPATSPASMLQLAKQKGFTHYHLTEHVPRNEESQLYPEEREAGLQVDDLNETFAQYVVEARRQQSIYSARSDSEGPSMHVLVGAELENVDGRTDACLRFLKDTLRENEARWKVDFCVGSVHHVYGIPIDFDKDTFEKALGCMADKEQEGRQAGEGESTAQQRQRAHLLLMLAYLDAQFELLKQFHPEVIGHFDLCRLFEPTTPMTRKGATEPTSAVPHELLPLLDQVDRAVYRNVEYAVGYGALFEVNTASVRKGWKTPYPAPDVLDVILGKHGRLCLSDDAHSHEQLGLNYHVALDYLRSKGVQNVWALEKLDGSHENGASDSQGHPYTFSRGAMAKQVPLSAMERFPEATGE